jgi:ABC-type cobalamin/Fe3+-siderophores transport system ATPase subunit/adenosyl cobinamide kinase/adenosyl cobinamide phosphate guanylyltransferase
VRQLGTSISANAIGFAYGLAPVFSDVSFRLEQGHFLGVVGPNGAGKTTLLKCLAGLLKPSDGEILLGGGCLSRLQREEIAKIVAVVPQDTQVGFGFSVEEFVMMGRIPHLKRFSRETDRDQEAVRWAIESTGMTPFAERLVTSLSGGERQRAAIARALAQEPKVLLLDEPTSHLDIRRQVEILDLVKIMSRERDITVVGVFHDLSLASMYCDEILMMTDGGTRYSGTPEEVFTQENVGSVYGDRVVVTDHPVHSTPLVAPRSRIELNNSNVLGRESGIWDKLCKVGELGKSDQSSKSGRLTLITGGARSGKSSFAERMAAESGTRVMYVATCEPMDAEMRARVSKHRERRPKSWITVEEPLEIASTITNEAKNYDAVLVDCLGLFVSNHLLAQGEDADDESKTEAVLTEVARFAKAARDAECHVIVVTNEVGMGVVPAYPLGRLFRDLLGWANQIVAEEADEVYLCVAGSLSE